MDRDDTRTLKRVRRNDRRHDHARIPDDLFERVDSEAKVYLLGWIASRGSIGSDGVISIPVHQEDLGILEKVRDLVCRALSITGSGETPAALTIGSRSITADVCRWLDVQPGGGSGAGALPELETQALTWAFVRGCFDAGGSVSSPHSTTGGPRCCITAGSWRMRRDIRAFSRIECSETPDQLEWKGNNALDFLAKLYESASLYVQRKKDLYLDWTCWVPALSGAGTSGSELFFRWTKMHAGAVAPFKERASDSGYDITLIRKVRELGACLTLYGSGIQIEPEYGWYFDLVPRSSIIKFGYVLANSIGVIDRGYRGEILVPLLKIAPEAPDLELPCRVVQIVPRPVVHLRAVEVESLDATSRSDKGFGSSGGDRA